MVKKGRKEINLYFELKATKKIFGDTSASDWMYMFDWKVSQQGHGETNADEVGSTLQQKCLSDGRTASETPSPHTFLTSELGGGLRPAISETYGNQR